MDACEEAVKRRKSSVQQGEVGGFAVMARLENHRPLPVTLSLMCRYEMSLTPAHWVIYGLKHNKPVADLTE